MKLVFLFAFFVAAALAVRVDFEDLSNVAGECAWGLPRDGRFQKCGLGSWKIGRAHGWNTLKESDLTFDDDFDSKWPEDALDNTTTCSVTMPGNGVLYQRLTDDVLFAHYRLRACAKVMGSTPCSVVIKNARNEIFDKLDFLPDATLKCDSGSSSNGNSPNCIRSCAADSGIQSITVKYVGLLPAHISIRAPEFNLLGWIDAGSFMPGDVQTFDRRNLTAWFNASVDTFPDIELLTRVGDLNVVDAVSFNCSALSLYPGRRLGDARQFIVEALVAKEGRFCSWSSDIAKSSSCACKNDKAKEVCLVSDKGFIADPAEQFYIGLLSDSCSCSFDNICLEQVNGEEGYFGLDWILDSSNRTAASDDSMSMPM